MIVLFGDFNRVELMAEMLRSFVVLIVKSVATAYGLFALGLAIVYSLSRSDTWRKSTEGEQEELQRGATHPMPIRIYRHD